MNVQYSAHPAPWDFQDPGSHSIFPIRASDKPFFVLGLLHRLREGVGEAALSIAPSKHKCWGPAALLLDTATLIALHIIIIIIIISSRRGAEGQIGRRGGVEGEAEWQIYPLCGWAAGAKSPHSCGKH